MSIDRETQRQELYDLGRQLNTAATITEADLVQEKISLALRACALSTDEIVEALMISPDEITEIKGGFGIDMISVIKRIYQEIGYLEDNIEVYEMDETFIPSGTGDKEIQGGEGEFKNPQILPRFRLLLETLKGMDLDLESCFFWRGKNDDSMVRKMSYVGILIPSLNKIIFVCDEEGNQTFVIDAKQNIKNYWSKTKNKLKEMDEVSYFTWTSPVVWKERLEDILTDQVSWPPTRKSPDTSKEYILGKNGVVKIEDTEIVGLKQYAAFIGMAYSTLRSLVKRLGIEKIEGKRVRRYDNSGTIISKPITILYDRKEIDSNLFVKVNEQGIGIIDDAEVVELGRYEAFRDLDGFKRAGSFREVATHNGLNPIGRKAPGAKDLYSKVDFDALLPRYVDEDGIIKIVDKEAVYVYKYSSKLGKTPEVMRGIIEEASLQPIEGLWIKNGSYDVEVYWKDEIDNAANNFRDLKSESKSENALSDGVVGIEGELYVGLMAYAKMLGFNKGNFQKRILSKGLTPHPDIKGKSGVHKVDLFKKDEVDQYLPYKLDDQGVVIIDGIVCVGLSKYAKKKGIVNTTLIEAIERSSIESIDTGGRPVWSKTVRVHNIYPKDKVDQFIEERYR